MALPLLSYSASTQNSRINGYEISGDDQPAIFSTQNVLSPGDLNNLIEAAYRQIFFHAFKADREPFLESQLRNGQLNVRDFIRGLLLSDTYKKSFYSLNSNYRFVEQTIQRVLGREPYSNEEKLAWSIVVASKGVEAFIDDILNSDEYLDNFGTDIVPYQRRRTLPGRDTGELPFNIKSPRYDEYYRSVLGFPQANWKIPVSSGIAKYAPQEQKLKAGDPALYRNMVSDLNIPVASGGYFVPRKFESKVPYRKLNFD